MMRRLDTAVILAAGVGARLRAVAGRTPKGLLPVGDTTPVARVVGLLRERGFRKIVLVVGFEAYQYDALAAAHPVITVVRNDGYATTGSMASLGCALPHVAGDFLLLESDLVFEARALDTVLADGSANVVLASGPTAATDEVWVETEGTELRRLSKNRGELGHVAGEFVGVCRISRRLAAGMDAALQRHVARRGDARMDYETGALVEAARTCPVRVALVADLLWGEIDDLFQYERVTTRIFPEILAREARGCR